MGKNVQIKNPVLTATVFPKPDAALTTILGLSTLALGMGSGAEMLQPMAIVTIGGLAYATLLTLFVVPALYDLFNRRPMKNHKLELEEIPDDSPAV